MGSRERRVFQGNRISMPNRPLRHSSHVIEIERGLKPKAMGNPPDPPVRDHEVGPGSATLVDAPALRYVFTPSDRKDLFVSVEVSPDRGVAGSKKIAEGGHGARVAVLAWQAFRDVSKAGQLSGRPRRRRFPNANGLLPAASPEDQIFLLNGRLDRKGVKAGQGISSVASEGDSVIHRWVIHFGPGRITVRSGDTVTWVDADKVADEPHTVTVATKEASPRTLRRCSNAGSRARPASQGSGTSPIRRPWS